MNAELPQIIEAIIFAADHPIKVSNLLEILKPTKIEKEISANKVAVKDTKGNADEEEESYLEVSKKEVENALELLLTKYEEAKYPFEVKKVSEGYQFFTKRVYYPYVKKATLNKNKKRLSKVALETLSIVAYRQPITKSELEFIRGVNCDYAVQKLLDKNLVSITGRSDAPGRPLLYSTSPFFMQYFGIGDMTELPKLKEFEELAEDHLDLFRQHQQNQDKDGQTIAEVTEEDEVLGGEETGKIEPQETQTEAKTVSEETDESQ
ncbi:UNVERIFIED_CONTAM: hypothetical protein GTU68_021028 [Idotea baltica]|nr:hypothetical protein [Idotea baltica]